MLWTKITIHTVNVCGSGYFHIATWLQLCPQHGLLWTKIAIHTLLWANKVIYTLLWTKIVIHTT